LLFALTLDCLLVLGSSEVGDGAAEQRSCDDDDGKTVMGKLPESLRITGQEYTLE
jgi:hypothetical protein